MSEGLSTYVRISVTSVPDPLRPVKSPDIISSSWARCSAIVARSCLISALSSSTPSLLFTLHTRTKHESSDQESRRHSGAQNGGKLTCS